MKMCDVLKRPVATLGAELRTLNTDIVKRRTAFERKVLRRMCWGELK
jgi:hypothetical protein